MSYYPWDASQGETWCSNDTSDLYKPEHLKAKLTEGEIMRLRIILGNALNGGFGLLDVRKTENE